ncbi:uncharacterized protein [Labrus bergylta]|uniref:uncharacterized protein n=1 Tax=Labrus bergylta TaxID=56723 RepID=UPI003313A0E8
MESGSSSTGDSGLDRAVGLWLQYDQNPKTVSMVQALVKEGAVEALKKCFSSRMEFGTAGLRAPMGPGISCMNDLTIIQTTQGFCHYLEESFENLKERGVVIGYDARAHPPSGGGSKRFASLAAAVFISRGVPVHLFADIVPTPFVACTQRRMFNGTYPSTPFINYYDTMEDINRRGHRAKMKIKDLKKSGLYPAASEAPVTPGPPKKKQKLSHAKNNQKPNHTPRQNADNHKPNHKPNQTPRPNTEKHKPNHKPNHNPNHTPGQKTGNNKPNRSHIFFQDNDFEPPAAKKSKRNKHKQPESAGNVKPWKPKRPVPTSREQPAKLILDEADDFPRGGAAKKQRKKKEKHAPSGPPGGHGDGRADRLSWTVKGEMQGSQQQKGEKKKRKRKQQGKGDSNKNHDAHMYPTDENLFIIKQKKRRSR